MCIIAVKPEKVAFSRNQLQVMWENNPHGAGFMYAENGVVKIEKGFLTLDSLCRGIDKIGSLRKMVLHFRIRTHGSVGAEMTHPFWVVKDELALVHNGVITAVANKATEKMSDTAIFAEMISAHYSNPVDMVKSWFHRDLLAAYIGTSKIVFMDSTGETNILNEKLGTWDKNIWYSNTRFRHEARTYLVPGAGGKVTSELEELIKEYKERQKELPIANHSVGEPKTSSPKIVYAEGVGNVVRMPVPFGGTEKKLGKSSRRRARRAADRINSQRDLAGTTMLNHWDRIPEEEKLEEERAWRNLVAIDFNK